MVNPKLPDTNGMSDTQKLEVLLDYIIKLADVMEIRLDRLEKAIKEIQKE